jgi:ADP-ribosylglycohydrolase
VIETAREQIVIASLLAVNLGDDADSTGARCGQFAGAIYT